MVLNGAELLRSLFLNHDESSNGWLILKCNSFLALRQFCRICSVCRFILRAVSWVWCGWVDYVIVTSLWQKTSFEIYQGSLKLSFSWTGVKFLLGCFESFWVFEINHKSIIFPDIDWRRRVEWLQYLFAAICILQLRTAHRTRTFDLLTMF